jgi:hypothetical protein
MFGAFALPTWILFTAGSALLNGRFRRARPHFFGLPLSFLGSALALQFVSVSPLAFWLFLPLVPLVWYMALAKLRVLRWFTEPKPLRTTEWRRERTDP